MTSRSKCASFSMSQMSWSRAGPRRPAVKMFVLSGTGAPVALVKRSGFDIYAVSRFQEVRIYKLDRSNLLGGRSTERSLSKLYLFYCEPRMILKTSFACWIVVRQYVCHP